MRFPWGARADWRAGMWTFRSDLGGGAPGRSASLTASPSLFLAYEAQGKRRFEGCEARQSSGCATAEPPVVISHHTEVGTTMPCPDPEADIPYTSRLTYVKVGV